MKKGLFVFILFCFSIISCKEKSIKNIGNSYYVEYLVKDDSLKTYLHTATQGKVAYYDKPARIFRVIPVNYMTKELEDMHFFHTADELGDKTAEGTKKYLIEVRGDSVLEQTDFSVKKLQYKNNTWVKQYDLGFIKTDLSEYRRADADSKRKALATQIVNTIAKDSYSF